MRLTCVSYNPGDCLVHLGTSGTVEWKILDTYQDKCHQNGSSKNNNTKSNFGNEKTKQHHTVTHKNKCFSELL